METPLTDDEKRALLAEAIKTSNVGLDTLARFVRANCPTYDMLSAQLPNGRSLDQCTQALGRMLEPDSDESRPNVQPPQSFPILTAPLQSQPYTVGRARLMVKPRSPPLSIIAPHRSTSSQARCVPDWSDPWEARYSADSYSPRPELIPFQPPPPDELRNPPQSSDSDFPRIGLTLSAPEAEEPDPWVPRDSALSRPSREELTSPPSKRVKPSPDLNCARVERGRGKQYGFDGMVGIFGSQRAGQLPHDAGKNTSDPRDADQSYLPMIRTSNNTSATGRTRSSAQPQIEGSGDYDASGGRNPKASTHTDSHRPTSRSSNEESSPLEHAFITPYAPDTTTGHATTGDPFRDLRGWRESFQLQGGGKAERFVEPGHLLINSGKDTTNPRRADRSRLSTEDASPASRPTLQGSEHHQSGFSGQDTLILRSPTQAQTKGSGDSETSSRTATPPKPADGDPSFVTDDICNTVLKAAFSTSLDELDTPTEAWECIYHFVAELSHIVGHHNHHTTQSGPSRTAGSGPTLLASASGSKPPKRKRLMPGPPGGTGGRDDEDDAEGNGQRTPNIAPSNKQPKTCGVFTCPFRKRNPLRFNVRSHLSCATRTFPDFTQLKRHVINFHKRPPQMSQVTCARCGEGFTSQTELDSHLRAESGDMCRVRAGGVPERATDPEDGISPEVLDRLRDRAAKRQVLEWTVLWKVLFPRDDTIPGPEFNPVIEIDEVEAIFQDEFDTLPPVVSNKLQRSIELSSGKPAATALAEVACDVFGGFFTGVIHKSRTTRGPLIKAQRPSTLMLAPSTQDMLAQHLNAPGYGQLQSFPPGPAASSPRDSSASGASGPTSTPTLSTFKAPSPLPPGTSGNKSVSLVDGPAGRWHRMNQRHLPAPSPLAHPSMCSGCFQPEGTACACFTPWDLEVDFGTPALDLSTAAEGFAFNQAPAL